MDFPLTLGLQKTGLPLIVTSGKLKNLCFLIDTGATNNILLPMYMNTLKMNLECWKKSKESWGQKGEYKETPVIEATFNFEGVDYTSTFSVFVQTDAITQVQEETGVQIHGVLGVQFLVENKWIVDLDRLEISTRK